MTKGKQSVNTTRLDPPNTETTAIKSMFMTFAQKVAALADIATKDIQKNVHSSILPKTAGSMKNVSTNTQRSQT